MFEAFRYANRRYGVTYFVVDSLAKLGMTTTGKRLPWKH
jgi:hypothetical protein